MNLKKASFIGLFIIIITIMVSCTQESSTSQEKPDNYEDLLSETIRIKKEELREIKEKRDSEKNDYLIVDEYDLDFKHNDGTVNYEAIEEYFNSTNSPQGATNEIYLSANNNSFYPHVLAHAEVAIYSDSNNLPWHLKKGDEAIFTVYIDTETFGNTASIAFGSLQENEVFLVSDIESSIELDNKIIFKEDIKKDGNYNFYLFRSGTEPVVIEWIDFKFN